MGSIQNIIYNTPLNLEIKSFADVNGFIFPLKIDIAKIKHNPSDVNFLKVNFGKKAEEDILLTSYENSPYKKQYYFERFLVKLTNIYDFIDWELLDENFVSFKELLGIETVRDFQKWFTDCHLFKLEDIISLSNTINYWIDYLKIDFINKVKLLFELDTKQPNIKLTEKDKTPKEYFPFLSYNYNMASIQTISEFPMGILFPENIGKAYFDWSWREQEIKRMYLSAKTRVENFRELVKAKQLDEIHNKK